MTFKYQKYIDDVIAEGYTMPELHQPNGMDAYRFAFADDNPNNHKPVLIQNPSRKLPGSERLSGYALSCFDNQRKAERRYASLCKSFKRTPKAIGDSLWSGTLHNDDGMVTSADSTSGHFDLYESASCNLTRTFKVIEMLWKR